MNIISDLLDVVKWESFLDVLNLELLVQDAMQEEAGKWAYGQRPDLYKTTNITKQVNDTVSYDFLDGWGRTKS